MRGIGNISGQAVRLTSGHCRHVVRGAASTRRGFDLKSVLLHRHVGHWKLRAQKYLSLRVVEFFPVQKKKKRKKEKKERKKIKEIERKAI